MEISHLPDGSIFANQAAYARRVLDRVRVGETNPVGVPADQHTDLSLQEPGDGDQVLNVPYKEAVESLLYLAMVMRPDIAYAVNVVSLQRKSIGMR